MAAVAEHLKKSGHFDDLPEWITDHKKLGVGTLSKIFGGRDRRHSSPAHFKRGTRKHLRYILQTFAKAGYVYNEEGDRKYMINGKGEQQMKLIASDLLRQMRNELKKKKEEEEEEEDEDEDDVDLGE